MTSKELSNLVEQKQWEPLEGAWMRAIEEGMNLADLSAVLETVTKAEQLDLAETLGWALLEHVGEGGASAEQRLPVAQAVVSAVPVSDELRGQASCVYRELHAQKPNFEELLKASGLLSGQSPRRAFRTLDVCLAIQDGVYLANRFDGQVVQLKGYQPALGEYELADARGSVTRLEPKKLADEFEPADENDFRVLCQHRPQELRQMLQSDPAGVLIGMCLSSGGKIDANELKDRLVPDHLESSAWSGWWNKARTAAKRCEQLSLDGRPIVVSYHPGGRTLEEELTPAAQAAQMPLDKLAVLQQYLREVQTRKLAVNAAFTAPIMEDLAQQARDFATRRPIDALAASLAIQSAETLGLSRPTSAFPSPESILAGAGKPARVVADLKDSVVWPAALEALSARPDAGDCLSALLTLVDEGHLDAVAQRLCALGRQADVQLAMAEALANPSDRLELFLWLWRGPSVELSALPARAELLSRMLNMLISLDHDWNIDPTTKKNVRQRIRAALSAGDYAVYRRAVSEMNEAVAGTIKRLIERTDGLAVAVHEEMMSLLRETHYGLFIVVRAAPWADENIIWSTQAAINRREDELKHLVEVTMLENARAIGAAAEHGDLRENSEWKFAMEERDLLRARAARMQDDLSKARAIRPEGVPTATVGIGSKVAIQRVDGEQATMELSFLGPWDSDVDSRIFSYQTPLGQSLMGKTVGDVVTLKLAGPEEQWRIIGLEAAL